MNAAASKLMSKPSEMADLLQCVSALEEVNRHKAELIRQTKEKMQLSEEMLQNKCSCIHVKYN